MTLCPHSDATVQFAQHYYTVSEGEESVAVCVQISLNSPDDFLECDVIVDLSTVDGQKAGTYSLLQSLNSLVMSHAAAVALCSTWRGLCTAIFQRHIPSV